MTRENIQKDPLTLRTKYPFDSLLQVDAILVVACRSLACRSLVNRALFSLGNVTDVETIKNGKTQGFLVDMGNRESN